MSDKKYTLKEAKTDFDNLTRNFDVLRNYIAELEHKLEEKTKVDLPTWLYVLVIGTFLVELYHYVAPFIV